MHVDKKTNDFITGELERFMGEILDVTHEVIRRKWGGSYSATSWVEGRVTHEEIRELIDEIIKEINP